MPRVTYPVLTEPLLSQPTALPSLLPAWAPQDAKPPAVPRPPAWLNAGGIVQPFVQTAATPAVAAWAGASAMPRSTPAARAAAADVAEPVLPAAQGSLVLGWTLVQEPKVWPLKPAPNEGTRPVLPPTPVTPTLGWAMSQETRRPAAQIPAFAGPFVAGPALPIAPVVPLSWRVVGEAARPAPPPPGFHSYSAPLIAFAPGGSLTFGWQLAQDGKSPPPAPPVALSPLVAPALVQVQATPTAWLGSDAVAPAKRPATPSFGAVQPPAITPGPGGPVMLGWQATDAQPPRRMPFAAMPAAIVTPVVTSAPLVLGWLNRDRVTPVARPATQYSITLSAPVRVLAATALPNVGWYGQPMQPPLKLQGRSTFVDFAGRVTFVPAPPIAIASPFYSLILQSRTIRPS